MLSQARSIASLTISFGLAAIPVKLLSATVASERISFHLLRQKDGSRVKQQYIAVNDDKLVERSEMVKGFEFAKDQYVMFTADGLKALEDATTHSIDITQFPVLAIAQMGVHLVFFLNISTYPDNTNNVIALVFGLLIVTLVVSGSLWIMVNLNANMVPVHAIMKMWR